MSRYATARKVPLRDVRVQLRTRLRSEGSLIARTYRSQCLGFEIKLYIDSDADPSDIADLIRVAHASCYAQDALARPMPIRRQDFLNGRPLVQPGSA